VSFTIKNQGSGTANASTTNIRINTSSSSVTPNDYLLASISIPSIPAGGIYNVNQPVTIPNGRPTGTNYIWVILDVNSTANQSNEQNDKAYTIFNVLANSTKVVTVANTSGYGLRLRTGPGLGYSVITTLSEGTQMTVIDGPVQADGYTWWKITGSPGTGWSAVGNWLVPNPRY
jgi:hypothetical protein